MWRPMILVTVIAMAMVVNCVNVFDPDNIKCCECKTMMPIISKDVDPQILPSPFIIKVAPNTRTYTPGLDINVNLTSIDENREFRSFMIQARRTDPSRNNDEPIGSFTSLDPIDAIQNCGSTYGSALVSAVSNIKPKSNVRLVWNPYSSFQGHVEFRATFVEDENLFWVKEKSEPLYDPNAPLPPELPPKYILPPIAGIDITGCGSTKGCYRVPEDCLEIECEYIFTWQDKGSYMVFEMSALTDGFNDRYFAVGFSDDIYMGKDMVFECVHNSTSEKVEVFQSYNQENDNKNIRLTKPKSGIKFEEGSYNSGRLRCRFHKTKRVVEAEDFDLTEGTYHLLMARGPSSNGHLKRHGLTVGHLPAASPDEVDILVYGDISGRARYHLVKAHACLMLLAWVFFAPIGLIWMKYYTTMWPNSRFLGEKYWFVAHANCTFWVVLLVLIGVILIFVEAGGWSKFPDLPQKAHPILGIIVFISVLVIPIIAIIRCPETHTCRPVGNWFYWLFWTIAFCLAIPNIFIGMEFGKAMVPWWLTWILCIFFLFNFICEVILEVHQCCTHKRNKERRKKWELQKKENPNAHIPEPWPVGRNFKRNVLLTHFIVCLIVVIISVIVVAVY
ncbi:putative ferric-chelate reductase 1 homolog [Mercenaria mercenaria]|uniref:putative ferric-chelate reductase 1 homolog n=1 Tax=Mercenaria mercenaria TaxID=6596 RepID=UPI00234E8E53|nr:putative ferric-chelate reductase 1 homolog [Mercenaria mercenaria]XP_045158668.2 putative ferric-chelate reductase 1 homolog [Mercenaria mercenaria]XP_045158669.2 putative ferric-chelate reductase 1 homolog [Mercenaria mercenaria]XP_045158670.2 putative ferric-chelate reductase 1 homolog [Mercenaria mercenaria]XP_045158671.2 putative ferric-chelate reductase 1 homolog [Mercenaria mercenaria]XP_045158672.2 putative ferric-chelate reductase 1 homolog [Mercenaria mercenaria]